MTFITFHVIAVIFLATIIRSTFGFGEALIAVPLLALRIPVQVAAPLAVLISITVAGLVLAQDWREVHFRSAVGLVLATAVGIPIGLLLLTHTSESIVKRVLAAIIIAFAAWSLVRHRAHGRLKSHPIWLLGCGFTAGILGGAYGMNGPPLVIYGARRGWSAQQFRATLQGYFLPASLIGMLGYWGAGLWVPAVTRYYLISLVPTFVAVWIGRMLNGRIAGRSFFRYLYMGLIGIGILLLIQAR